MVLAMLAGLFLEHILLAAFGSFSLTQPLTHPFAGEWTWCSVIGLGIAGAAALYAWVNPRLHEVALEIVAELRKVTWPSFAETRAATVAVVVFSLIAALLLGLFDVSWQFITDKIQNPAL